MAGRGVIQKLFHNFKQSFKVARESSGTLVGQDPFGNTYFEIPSDPRRGKRRPTRWYQAITTNQKDVVGLDLWAGFDSTIPSEWESWLRHRRDEPPTEEQIHRSLALAQLKKMNAAKLEEKRIKELEEYGQYDGPEPKAMDHEKSFFPKYDEYEVMPGEMADTSGKDRWATYKNPYLDEKYQPTRKK